MYTKPLSKRVEPRELVEGRKYVLGMSIPLMPAFEIGDLMLKQKKGLMPRMFPVPVRGIVEVVEVKMKRSVPWYRVKLSGEDALMATANEKKKVEGWLNSVALIKCGVFETEED